MAAEIKEIKIRPGFDEEKGRNEASRMQDKI
jgi:hypothetical protein